MQSIDSGILDTSDKFCIGDIQGILYHKDTPLVDFCIDGFMLCHAKDLSGGKYYPCHLSIGGLTYNAFNAFFNDRVVREHAQDIRSYLNALGLKHYNFEEMVKKMNGWDALGFWWVRFPDIGARCWNDIITQKYPIY